MWHSARFPIMALTLAMLPIIGGLIGGHTLAVELGIMGLIYAIMWSAEKIVDAIERQHNARP